MIDIERIVKLLKPLPWRVIALTMGGAFLLATVVATIIAFLLTPRDPAAFVRDTGVAASPIIPEPGITLDPAAVEAILSRNIFNSEGKVGDEKGKQKSEGDEMSITDLPIKVLGIIYGGDPFTGIALVENTSKKVTNSFLINDQIDTDATLERIEIDRLIILRGGGRREVAMLEREDIVRSTRKRGKMVKPKAGEGDRGFATDVPPESFAEPGFDRKGGNIEMSLDYKNKLLTSDFAQVLQDAKATPNMVDGDLKGFRLDRIRNDSIYQKAGLQNGDVIEEINGIPLSDTAQAIKLLQSLRNESEIEVRYSRGGSKQNLNMKVK
jgi:general secretion pathway protein C